MCVCVKQVFSRSRRRKNRLTAVPEVDRNLPITKRSHPASSLSRQIETRVAKAVLSKAEKEELYNGRQNMTKNSYKNK